VIFWGFGFFSFVLGGEEAARGFVCCLCVFYFVVEKKRGGVSGWLLESTINMMTRRTCSLAFFLTSRTSTQPPPSKTTPTPPQMCIALVTWQAVQVAVLLSQDLWGPQYMIPARFLPPKYDYYRPIPQQALRRGGADEGPHTHTGGSSQESESSSSSPARARGREGGVGPGGEEIEMTDIEGGSMPECVICYNGIDVAHPGGYMVSPCDHLFHRECLERWMDIKLECPVCRASLPMR
jgi:hypothetical protein